MEEMMSIGNNIYKERGFLAIRIEINGSLPEELNLQPSIRFI
jgi:hypothetical protein